MTHPAVYAISAGLAIGFFLYSIVNGSFRQQEKPHGRGPRNDSPPPPVRCDSYRIEKFRKDIDEESEICTICRLPVTAYSSKDIICSHLFHEECLVDLMKYNNDTRCPNCRAPIQFV